MKKSLKVLLSATGVVLILLVFGPMLITWNQYKDLIQSEFYKATSRELIVNGDVRFGILPSPYAKLTDITIKNPQGTASKDFATVKSLDVGVALLPLLSKKVQVTHITVSEPAITLETMANGQNNWQFKPVQETAAVPSDDNSASEPSAISIDDFTIEKGYVRLVDVPKKSQQVFGPIEGKFNIENLNGPISGKGSVTVNEKIPVDYDVKVDLSSKDAIPFVLGMNVAGKALKGDFKGQYSKTDSSARVESAISIPDLEKVLAAASKDNKAPDLPAWLKDKTSASGLIEWKDGKASIDNLMINSGGAEVSGGLNVDTANPMTVTLDLARVVLPPEMSKPSALAPTAEASNKNMAKTLEETFKSASGFLDTALPASPMNFVITANQLPLPNKPTMRDVRIAATTGPKGVTIQNVEAKLPGNTTIQLSGALPARDDGKIGTATIKAIVNSQNIQAAMGETDATATPLNANTTILLSRDDVRLQPLQIVQNGQTVQGDVVYNPKAAEALSVAIKGSALDLDSLLGSNKKTAASGASADAGNSKASSDPLAKLQGLKAKLTADLGSVTYQDKTANKVAVNALLSDKGLQLQQANIGDLGGMVVQASGSIGKFSPLSDVDLTAKASTANLSQTLRALGNEAAQNLGASNFDAAIKGSADNLKVGLNGTIDQGKVAINGTAKNVNTHLAFDGSIDVSHPETATIVRNFGGMQPATNLGPFALKADVAYGTNTLKADNLLVKLGSAGTLEGKINIQPQGDGKSIDATLKADKLALAALTGDSTETNSKQAETAPVDNKDWPRDPIDLSALRNMNGQATVSVGELLYKKFVINDFKTSIKFANNAMTVNQFSGQLFDAGKFSINGQLAPGAKGQAHRGDFAIAVNNTDAKKLFEALGSKPFSEGTVDLDQKITFNGASQYDIVRSLNGDGSLKVTNGVVNGIDLDALAAKLDRPNSLSDFAAIIDQTRAGGQTTIGNLSAPITIRNGVVNMDNVEIKTQKTKMAMQGDVNLPSKTIDARGTITFIEQRNLPPLTMALTGPMDNPAKNFDTRSFTTFYAQKAAEKYTAKATEKIQGKLNKLLGVPEQQPAAETPAAETPAATTETPTTAPTETAPASGTEMTVPQPEAPTAPTPPAATEQKPQKPKDALKALGGQMLNDFLTGGQQQQQ